jgi:hypothetical protein
LIGCTVLVVGVASTPGEHPKRVRLLNQALAGFAKLAGAFKKVGDVGLVLARRILHSLGGVF